MSHYHELVPLHSRIFSSINKFYPALIFIYYFLISTGVSYIFFPTKSVTMTGHFFLLLPDLKWNQPADFSASDQERNINFMYSVYIRPSHIHIFRLLMIRPPDCFVVVVFLPEKYHKYSQFVSCR